ncbi:MAG: hypothetical protein K2K10_07735, partial [Acetatifactor sp.]|nr:hypothetical protein [Acetatifactor sp.]
LAAGTYSVVSPLETTYNRGAWLIKATVDDVVKTPVMIKNYVLDASTTPNDVDENGAAVDNVEIPDGTKLGTDDYFEVVLGVTSDGKEDKGTVKKRKGTEYLKGYEIGKNDSASINFTVKGTADVELVVSSTGGSNHSLIALKNAEGKLIKADSATGASLVAKEDGSYDVYGNQTTPSTLVFKGLAAGTYSVVSPLETTYNRGAWLIKATVTDTFADAGEEKPDVPVVRKPWEEVEAPEIVSFALNEKNSGKITVIVKGLIGADGADSMEVDMLDEKGEVVEQQVDSTRSAFDKVTEQYQLEKTFNFTPASSGDYTFIARLVRAGEENKETAETKAITFALPLAAPVIKSVTNKGTVNGKGRIEIAWQKVTEANSYEVTVSTIKTADGAESKAQQKFNDVVTLQMMVEGLEVGSEVEVAIVAVRKRDNSKSEAYKQTIKVNGETERTWALTVYGASTNMTNNGFKKNDDGTISLYSKNGSGKLVPATTDGLAFYYTRIDPDEENFTLTADVKVDRWTYSNGQDGFGLMVSDAVGESGNSDDFWTNAYQLVSTKIEYRWDPTLNDGKGGVTTADVLEPVRRYSMRQGLGWIAKTGATALDVANINAGKATAPKSFSSTSGTLETSAGQAYLPGGDYNMVENISNPSKSIPTYGKMDPVSNMTPVTEFKLQIQRNNTGYILRYLSSSEKDEAGKPVVLGEQIFYDEDRNTLTQIDKNNIYVGFIAARNAEITISNIDITTIHPDDDEAAAEREVTTVISNYTISSPEYSNSSRYNLIFSGNQDGNLTILGENDKVVANTEITAGKKYTFGTTLKRGANVFDFTFVPNPDYTPGQYQVMDNHDTWHQTFTVTYQELDGESIYVAPTGKSDNAGTVESPLDIYTAVNYAHAGQTIYLAGGKYDLVDILLIGKGHDGTEKKPITMMAAADAVGDNRPVLDFSGQKEPKSAFIIAGDYWHLKGFDVTKSLASQKGIQVSGHYGLLEDLRTYLNGNTGIQIARYGSDSRADWPAYNTVLNCTSYLNADPGFEDADGFAAKLTIGDGNRFVGCIAAYNADDGWDLFAKRETGSIGAVTIENCLAFKNGYMLGPVDEEGKAAFSGVEGVDITATTEGKAGNGNGFKMGGDSLPGGHVLKNSIAFGNRAKGIDSNSCPDIQVYNSISFNNEGYNVAFYTNNKAISTDYFAQGVLSYRTKDAKMDDSAIKHDQINLQTQNESKVYGTTNFYFDGSAYVNSAGEKAADNWFKNMNMQTAIRDRVNGIHREADGTINMGGFLELTDKVPEGVGAKLGNTSYETIIESAKPLEVNVIAAEVTTLNDVKLPEGYTWAYPETLTAVFAGTKSEFIAKDKETGAERAVVVNFIDVIGVELTADSESLIGEGTLKLTAKPITAPEVTDEEFASAQHKVTPVYEIKESSKLSLNVAAVEGEANAKNVTRATASGEGIAKFTAVMSVTIKGKTVKKQATYSFTTRKAPFEFSYDINTAGVTKSADGSSIMVASGVASFTLDNLKVTGVTGGETVKVTTNDSKVITASGNTLTVKGEGTATITLTATSDKTVVKVVSVTVRGKEFKTNVSTITVDKAKISGAQITAVACYGEKIVAGSVSVKSVLKGKNAAADLVSKFTVTPVVGNIYSISADDTIPNGTYNLVLQGKLEGSAADAALTEFEPLIVKVIETKPTVSIKQTKKVNLFYKYNSNSSRGTLKPSSKLASVTLTQTDTTSDFKLAADGKTGNYTVSLKKEAEGKKSPVKKMTVKVSFNGYKSKYDKEVNINVGTENRAPKLVLEVDNKILYTQLGIKDTEIRILDKATNTYVSGANVVLASSTNAYQKANANFTLDEENGAYVLGTTKSGSAKISVQDADWTKEIVLSQAITVNTKKPTATFAVAKLNSTPEYATKEQASALITVKNVKDYTVKDLKLTGTNANSTKLLDYLNYSVIVDEEGQNLLQVSLNKALPTKANGKSEFSGTYSFKAEFKLNKIEQTATVRVNITPMATVTTSQKGSIDLVNRSGSSVTVKPVLKNLNGTVINMYLKDDASNQFDVTWDSEKAAAVVSAKELTDMKKGGKYKVTPVFQVQLENGVVEVEAKTITITPKSSNVKT